MAEQKKIERKVIIIELISFFDIVKILKKNRRKTIKLSNKGQITIPIEIRQSLCLSAGSKLYISKENNKIILQPLNIKYFRSLIGIANTNGKALMSLMKEKKIESKF